MCALKDFSIEKLLILKVHAVNKDPLHNIIQVIETAVLKKSKHSKELKFYFHTYGE